MARTATPPRPKPVEIGPLRASTMKRWREHGSVVEWYWRARRKGERDTLWAGWGTRDFVQERLAELVAAGLPAPRREESAGRVRTVGDLLDTWAHRQKQRPDLSPHTVDHYDKCARHIVAWLRDLDCRRLDRGTIEQYRNSRIREKASRRLVLQELRIMGMAWRWGQECGHVPARALPRVTVTIDGYVLNHHTPAPEDLPKVLEHLTGDARLAIHLLGVTGARISEVCELRLRDFNATTGELQLCGKTGPRSFPLPAGIVTMLEGREGAPDAYLLDLGKRARDQNVRSKLKRACKAAGVQRFTPHGLRRMVVDRMARSGVDVATAASLTGHSPEVMLRHYRQVSDEDRKKAVAKAKLGHFPEKGQVIQGPWEATGE